MTIISIVHIFPLMERHKQNSIGEIWAKIHRKYFMKKSEASGTVTLSGYAPELLRELREERDDFEEAVVKAETHTELTVSQKKIVSEVLNKLKAIETQISLKSIDSDEYDALLRRIQHQTRLRAEILPDKFLDLEVTQILNDLNQWGVPSTVLDQMANYKNEGMARNQDNAYKDVDIARQALDKIYKEYDFWSGYVYWHYKILLEWTRLISLVGVLLGLSAVWAMFTGNPWPFLGFVSASTAGSCISILMKPPTMNVYGISILSPVQRIFTGIAASILGYGLLATGIINIPVTTDIKTLPIIITECSNGGCNVVGKKTDPSKDTCDSGCTPISRAVLLAVALAIGFSERALSSFEGAIFSKLPKPEDDKKA